MKAQTWMLDADGELMPPALDLYHELHLTEDQWAAWWDVWDQEANARTRGRGGVRISLLTGDPEQPRWVEVVDALIDIDRIDKADRATALKSEWIKFSGCPGCGSSGAFLRRDAKGRYKAGQVRLSCGRRCRTRDVLRQLGVDVPPDVYELVGSVHQAPAAVPSTNKEVEIIDATDDEDNADSLLRLVRNGDWLDAQDFPPLAWAIPGLVPEGFGLFTGPPKIGKSWCALGIGLAVATGGLALGKVATGRPRPVLYLALEDGPRRLQWRARRLLAGEPIPANLHHVTELRPEHVLRLIAEWLSTYGDQQPLVMLDTLGKVMPAAVPGESAYQRDYRIGSQLKALVDRHPGSTLLVVHHVRKATGEDWMDSTSGTNGLNGAADFTVNLSRRRNDVHGTIRVTGRDVTENEYAVTVDEGSWTVDGLDLSDAAARAEQARAAVNLGDNAAQVLKYVTAQDEPVTAKQVGDALDLPRARDYLGRLVESGRLTKIGRGSYASVASVASVASAGAPDSVGVWQVSEHQPIATDATDATPTPRGELGRDDDEAAVEPGPKCQLCGQPLLLATPGRTVCERCRLDHQQPGQHREAS